MPQLSPLRWHSSLCVTPFPVYRLFPSRVCLFLCLVSLQPNLVCKKPYFSLYRILGFIRCQGLTDTEKEDGWFWFLDLLCF